MAQPIISSFSPAHASIGTTVFIYGTNFNENLSGNVVFFGSTIATVNSANSTILEVVVPAGSSYDYISVTNLLTGLTAYSSQPFDVSFPYCRVFDTSCYRHSIDLPYDPYAYNVLACDLDVDGKPDILLSKYGGFLSAYRNTSSAGDFSFDNMTEFPAHDYPHDMALGDLNGDGKPDLVVAHGYEAKITYYLNISEPGAINFAPPVWRWVAGEPGTVSISDLDKDGRADLVVTYAYKGSINILRNTSSVDSISFATALSLDSERGQLIISDFDGDSKPDLARNNIYHDGFLVYLNRSTVGLFAFDMADTLMPGYRSDEIAACDIDGDGKPELIVDARYGDSLLILQNTSVLGNISFGLPISYISDNIWDFRFADVDGNGTPDIVTLRYGNYPQVSTFLNNSTTGNISLDPKIDFAVGYSPESLDIADMDGDGRPDFIIPNENPDKNISIYRNYAIPPPPDICMVTTDAYSVNNMVYWDKSQYGGVDSIIVYRETVSDVYKRIGAVPVDSPNFFVDTVRQLYFPYTGDPNIGSYRYKLQIKDSCGSVSELGPYHNTIYMTQNGGTFSWNNYQIEGLPTPIPQLYAYHLLRRNYETEAPWELIGGVSSSQLTLNDPDYQTFPDASRRVETQWSIDCSDKGPTNAAYSNIVGFTSDVNNELDVDKHVMVQIYPNPFSSETRMIISENVTSATLSIYNSYGQLVERMENISGQSIAIYRNKLPAGIYYFQLTEMQQVIAGIKIVIIG